MRVSSALRSGGRGGGPRRGRGDQPGVDLLPDGLRPAALERLFAVAVPVQGGGALIVPTPRRGGRGAGADHARPRRLRRRPPTGSRSSPTCSATRARVGVEEDHLTFARAHRLQEPGREPSRRAPCSSARGQGRGRAGGDPRGLRVITEVMERMFARLRPGDVERAVNARVAFELREAGATESHPLILFGENASQPARVADPRRSRGDVICADVSARIGGYWGDLTRCGTVGPPSDWARRGLGAGPRGAGGGDRRPAGGTPARDVDAAQRAIVERGGRPRQRPARRRPRGRRRDPRAAVPRPAHDGAARPGHVLTIEPGPLSHRGRRIRLEDDVAVTSGSPVCSRTCRSSCARWHHDRHGERVDEGRWTALGAHRAAALRSGVARRCCGDDDEEGGGGSARGRRRRGKQVDEDRVLRLRGRELVRPGDARRDQGAGAEEGVEVEFFDPNFDAAKQVAQIQNAITSASSRPSSSRRTTATPSCRRSARRSTRASPSSASSRRSARDYDTIEPQVDGLPLRRRAADRERDGARRARRRGVRGHSDPCQVAYLQGFKRSPLDNARTEAVQAALEAGAERRGRGLRRGGYTQESGLKAAQNVLQAHPDVDVMIGSSQAIAGAEQAIEDAGADVALVGNGGSRQAVGRQGGPLVRDLRGAGEVGRREGGRARPIARRPRRGGPRRASTPRQLREPRGPKDGPRHRSRGSTTIDPATPPLVAGPGAPAKRFGGVAGRGRRQRGDRGRRPSTASWARTARASRRWRRSSAACTSPTTGELLIDGRAGPPAARPRDALAAGIATDPPGDRAGAARAACSRTSSSASSRARLGVGRPRAAAAPLRRRGEERTGLRARSATRRVGALRTADQQKVEILRAIARDARA